MIQSIIDFIESLGYVLVAARDAARESCGWMRPCTMDGTITKPPATFARDGMYFMSRAHARRDTRTCGEFFATRVDTLRIFQDQRPDRAQTLALAHRARELGAPTKGSVIIDIQWDESRKCMDKDILMALVGARTPRRSARVPRKLRKHPREYRMPDVLIISRVESYDAIPTP